MRLVVEVLEANDLMPKNGHGSASPFVEVSFDGQRHRTKTVAQDLNPTWNETLVFNVADASALQEKTIEVVVLNERSGGAAAHHNFLGRVRISGSAVAPSPAAAAVCCCPLDKRGIFSNIRGDIALRVYTAPDPPPETPSRSPSEEKAGEKNQKSAPEKKPKDKHHSHSIPANGGGYGLGFNAAKVHPPPPGKRGDFSRAPSPHLGFGLVETWPTLAARMGFRSDKMSSTYDLVEQMQYLYVKVVKARDLPVDDPEKTPPSSHVEVKLGNYKGLTKPADKTQNPNWSQVFAFSKERIQSHLLEVWVKEKDKVLGRIVFDLAEVPLRVPPDSPLAPQWYRLEDNKGRKLQRGEMMLAVWMGTQADEAFPEAWHSDAHSVSSDSLSQTRSKVYFSPRLCYLRVHVIEAQDLGPAAAPHAKIQLSGQLRRTRPAPNSAWNEELLLVAAEPYDEPLVITVEDKDSVLGRLILPVDSSQKRLDHKKLPFARWFSLEKPPGKEGEEKKFSGKIHLRISLDAGYHVLDESAQYCSDLLPAARNLWKPSIGILELGILGARNLAPLNPYCVAKFGPKWVRTRTLVNTSSPRWNEQYTWEVHDPCTVLTVGVFDNGAAGDQRIGKVRIRLSTLETDRLYTHFYPLLALHPSGLKKAGELHLAVRFTCTSWVNMISLYGEPLLPKMHYTEPISVAQLNYLRHQAVQIVSARLARAEPPLRREVVECMLDVDAHMFSLRRSKANFYRITALLSGFVGVSRWLETICEWSNPGTTVLVHVLFLVLVWYPELILPTFFLYLFLVGIWNFRVRPRNPVCMDAKLSHAEWAVADEIDEELDTFPSSRPNEVVRMRYDRLRSVAGRLQTVAGDLATQGERAHALLSWRDPRATSIAVFMVLFLALLLYSVPFQVLATLGGLYLLRHPRFRARMPSVVFNFYRRLPAKSDVLL